jgi:enterochelin esterase-like enzyme
VRSPALIRSLACGAVAVAVAVWLGGASPVGPTVAESQFRSAAMDGTAHFAIYLPTGYDGGRRRYPVVYFLHGLPAKATAYKDDSVAKIGQAAERTGRPAIVVAAQGARADDTDPEWHDWGPGRDWETATAKELVAFVDAHYRTIAERRARALVGVSAGGYGAAIIGLRHPGTFSVVESWSGYFHATSPSGSAPLDTGSRERNRQASVHTYVQRARQIAARYGSFDFDFYVGDRDPFAPENQQLHEELLAAGVGHAYAHYQGSHTASFWDQHRDDWIAMAVDALEPAA